MKIDIKQRNELGSELENESQLEIKKKENKM